MSVTLTSSFPIARVRLVVSQGAAYGCQGLCRQGYESGRGLSREERGNNADAHLKRQIMGREVVVAVTNDRQDGFALLTRTFGTWERIFYGEFDGRRRKRVLVKIIGE